MLICKYLLARRFNILDCTKLKIINSAMELIKEKGYSLTTTKEIALKAGINECTIFRKFKSKKDIVLEAMKLSKWNPNLSESNFVYIGDLEKDLTGFLEIYTQKVTPEMVKLSIGLRTPELYEYTADGIMKVPQVFKNVLIRYFEEMLKKGKIKHKNTETLAMTFISIAFGFVFLDASFGNKLTSLSKKEYIENSVKIFIGGIN